MSADAEVNQELAEYLTCPICFTVPRQGILVCCPNEHLVCEGCFRNLKRPAKAAKPAHHVCPICNQNFFSYSDGHLPYSRFANEFIEKVNVQCRYASQGCPVIEKRKALLAHELACAYGTDPCKYRSRGCSSRADTRELAAHEIKCQFRDVNCKFSVDGCEEVFMANQNIAHLRVCAFQKMQCQSCKTKISICKMEEHLREQHQTKSTEGNELAIEFDLRAPKDKHAVLHHLGDSFVCSAVGHKTYFQAHFAFLGTPNRAAEFAGRIAVFEPNGVDAIAAFSGKTNKAIAGVDNCLGLMIPSSYFQQYSGFMDSKSRMRVSFTLLDSLTTGEVSNDQFDQLQIQLAQKESLASSLATENENLKRMILSGQSDERRDEKAGERRGAFVTERAPSTTKVRRSSSFSVGSRVI